jgi:hypothetical protein
LGFGVWGLRFGVYGLELTIEGIGFRAEGLEFPPLMTPRSAPSLLSPRPPAVVQGGGVGLQILEGLEV